MAHSPIELLRLKNRPYFALLKAGITTLEQLQLHILNKSGLEEIPGIGPDSADNIRTSMSAFISSQLDNAKI